MKLSTTTGIFNPIVPNGNIDATNTNTAPTWTNKPGALRPVESQLVVTNSATQYINVSDEISPARRTYNPSTSAAGDTEAIAAKGRLVLVNGSTPALAASLSVNPSELFSQRNMTYNENSIALPSDRGTLEVSGANLMYEGARVKSWMLGRDVNPAGRGDGAYYAQGAFNLWGLRPVCTPQAPSGFGNSVNNGTKCDSTSGACNCALQQDPLSRCACQVDELCSQCHNMIFQCGSSLPDWPVDANGNTLPLREALKDPSFAQAYCGYLRGNCVCLEEQGSPPCSPYNAWFCCFEFCHSGDMGGGPGPGGTGGGGGFRSAGGGGGCTSCGGKVHRISSGSGGNEGSDVELYALGLCCEGLPIDRYKLNIRIDPSCATHERQIRDAAYNLLRCIECLLFGGAERLWTIKNLDAAKAKLQCAAEALTKGMLIKCQLTPGQSRCFGQIDCERCSEGSGAVTCVPQSCDSHPRGLQWYEQNKYVMLCYDTFSILKADKCYLMDTLLHEGIHFGCRWPHKERNAWNDFTALVINSCFPDCNIT